MAYKGNTTADDDNANKTEDADNLLGARNLLKAQYYTDSSELDCTPDSDSIFTSEAESMDKTEAPVPGTRCCVTPLKRQAWRLAQAAANTQTTTTASVLAPQPPPPRAQWSAAPGSTNQGNSNNLHPLWARPPPMTTTNHRQLCKQQVSSSRHCCQKQF